MAGSASIAIRVEDAVCRAVYATTLFQDWRVRASVLESIAATLDVDRDEVIETAAAETALTPDELVPEFARLTGTLRVFAGLVRDGAWVRAAIDTAGGAGAVGPDHDVRRMLIPLSGVVAVFGASNFPLAYGVCGGDTASSLAAGCGVVVKEHPAHPLTGRLVHKIAQRGIEAAGVRPELLGYVEHGDPSDHGVAELLVAHELVCGVGFTGSVGGGRAVENIARQRRTPIPVFAEMGSVNSVAITHAAILNRNEAIAEQLAASILARFGQQCTRPGLILVPDAETPFLEVLAERIRKAPGRDMLAPWIRDTYAKRIEEVAACEGVEVLARGQAKSGPRGASAALFKVQHMKYHEQPSLAEEIFGPAAIVVDVPGFAGLDLIRWPRSLVCTVLYDSEHERDGVSDVAFADLVLRDVGRMSGRIVFNGPPTGVRVAHGTVHGGPWPATNRPDTTAVGPYAIERWCRPVCYQNCPDALLPEELRDANPRGILRIVNGEATRDRLPPRRG